jgi:hypothetical protein
MATCTNNGSKIKLSTNRGRITFAWIWGLTGITFARRKGITIARKIYGITFRRGFFPMNFFFYTCMLQINLFLNYLYVILIFFVFILKADESGE